MQLKTTMGTATMIRVKIIVASALCVFAWAPQAFACEEHEEMTVSEFLNAVEKQQLSDAQIYELAHGRMELPLRRAQGRTAVVKRLLSVRDAYGDTVLSRVPESLEREMPDGGYEQRQEQGAKKESCCQKIMRLCSRFPHSSLS